MAHYRHGRGFEPALLDLKNQARRVILSSVWEETYFRGMVDSEVDLRGGMSGLDGRPGPMLRPDFSFQ
jgi:hypothetical protein